MIKDSRLLLISLLCLIVTQTQAADSSDQNPVKYYDIELIVFKNNSVPKGHEFNLPTPSATPTENTLDLSSSSSIKRALASGFTPLSQEELQLQDNVKRIVRSSRYNLLTHTGWRQPGLEENKTIPVWIKGGRVFGRGYSSIDQITTSTELENNELTETETQTESIINPVRSSLPGLYELEGQITITLSRYLHTKAELVLRKPTDTANVLQQNEELVTSDDLNLIELEGQLLLNYGLSEQRRMRSKKLHYLDHPEFGVLVLITPYEKPEEDLSEVVNDPQSIEVSATPAS